MPPGDIVLSIARNDDGRSTKVPRTFIRAGQWLKIKVFGGDASPTVPIVHAAIAIDDGKVIESVADGIKITDLTADDRRSAVYYTCRDENLARAAAVAASQFYQDRAGADITGRYDVWKAILSVFKFSGGNRDLTQRINDSISIGDSAFCSQFVANCYEIGNLYGSANLTPPPPPVFPLRPSATTPYELAQSCENGGLFYFSGFWDEGQDHPVS